MIFVDTGFFFALFAAEEKQIYSERLARIYRTSYEEQLEAFAYLKQHKDKGYSAVDCLSFIVMLKLGIKEAWSFDEHFAHRFIARPGSR